MSEPIQSTTEADVAALRRENARLHLSQSAHLAYLEAGGKPEFWRLAEPTVLMPLDVVDPGMGDPMRIVVKNERGEIQPALGVHHAIARIRAEFPQLFTR